MQKETQGITTPHAGLTYILLSFAHFTDGELTDEERDEIMQRSIHTGGRWGYTKEEMIAGWEAACSVHDSCETWETMKNVFVDVLNLLGKQEGFGENEKKYLLEDLEAIMNADHKQHENELYWVNKIKEVWNL